MTPSEVDMINTITGSNDSYHQMKILAEKSGAASGKFGEQVPLIMSCAIAFDNKVNEMMDEKVDICTSELFYQMYSLIGTCVIAYDEALEIEEYERLERFLRTIYKKVSSELHRDIKDFLPPSSQICKNLSGFDVKPSEAQELIRKAKSKNGDDKPHNKKSKPSEEDTSLNADDKKNEQPEETLEDLMKQLNDLIGLYGVKYEVTSLINLCRVKNIREANGLTFPPLSLHLVFSGNPGTGKTTVARLLAKIYKKIGVLSQGHLVEVDRAGLVGGYVGQTALKVQDVVKSALGGVLFIDEAYSLTSSSSENDYGIEAVDTLVKAMEDNREDLIVIVAGYPKPMEKFIQSNPGLQSRFNKYISFQDYSPEELVQVFKLFCQQSGYRASLDALAYVQEHFEKRCAEKTENFANAREVRNLFEHAMMRQANRIVMVSEPTQDFLTLLKREDVSGESEEIGKSEQLAHIALHNMPMDTRLGIAGELMGCQLDELELTAHSVAVLKENNIHTLGDLVTYLETGKPMTELTNMNEQLEQSIVDKLIDYGYNSH